MPSQPDIRPRSYIGWQQEKVAFIFGLSGQRALALGAAVLAAIWPLAVARAADGVVCWPAAVILAALALARIGGRTVDEWAAAAGSYYLGTARDQHKFAAAAFSPPGRGGSPPPMDLPGILAPLRILEAGTGTGQPMAVVHHPQDRTYTAVAKISYPGIGLADSARRDLRVAGWGALLSGLCAEGQPITRIQALQRLLPEPGAALIASGRLPIEFGGNGRSMCQRHRIATAKSGKPNKIPILAPSPFRPLCNKMVRE